MRTRRSQAEKEAIARVLIVLKKDLGPEDRLNIDPVRVELVDNTDPPYNGMVPIETPRHLLSAAKEEPARLIKSECLEPVHHPTNTFSKASFV